jgi:hypothetical protein
LSNIASGFLLDAKDLLRFQFFSIVAASTPDSSKAIGDIAAACIDTFLATSSAPSIFLDNATKVAILFPEWI